MREVPEPSLQDAFHQRSAHTRDDDGVGLSRRDLLETVRKAGLNFSGESCAENMLRCLLQRALPYVTGEGACRPPTPYRLDRDIGMITADIR